MESYDKSISSLIKVVSNKDEFIKKILSMKDVVEDLYNDDVNMMIKYSSNPEKLKAHFKQINPRWYFGESVNPKKLTLSNIYRNI